jgi:hypothetical protein
MKEETRGRGRLVLLHPESPGDPRGTEDGMGSSDENRLKSGSKRGTEGLTGPFFAVRMKKKWSWEASGRDEWRCSYVSSI